jgi:integrase
VTATDEEKARILAAAPDHLRLWTLLCSDLAMRSGTAAKIAPRHYDPTRRILAFTTKYGATLTLPTTDAIDALIQKCNLDDPEPFTRQLWRRVSRIRSKHPDSADQDSYERQFKALRLLLGITRRIVPHDLRRTTAVAMLRESGDVRDVQALLGHRSLQSTIWYLDHDIRPVSRSTLENIKRPFLVKPKEKTA